MDGDPIEAYSAPELGVASQFALLRLLENQAVQGGGPIEAHSAPELGAGSQLVRLRLPAEKDLRGPLLLTEIPLGDGLMAGGLALALLATRLFADPGPSRLLAQDLSGFRIKLAK